MTTKASITNKIYRHQVVALYGKIYSIGGRDSTSYFDTVEEYNPVTNIWTTKAPLPDRMCNHKIAVENGEIYCIGGSSETSKFNSVEAYDPISNTWTTKASMTDKRVYHEVAVVNGKIYVIGGHNGTNNINSVEEYTPTEAAEAPTNLTATAGNAQVSLSWTPATGAAIYNVKRSETPGGPYTTIAENVTTTSYTDTAVTNGTTYYYIVTAVNEGGESSPSNEASATPAAPAAAGKAILVITMVNGTEKEYDLSMAEVNAFTDWYDGRANGAGKAYFTIDKGYNKGPFQSRTDYIVFDKILDFEINRYE